MVVQVGPASLYLYEAFQREDSSGTVEKVSHSNLYDSGDPSTHYFAYD